MTQASLATRADFWLHGLQPESFAPARRPIASVDTSNGVLRLGAMAPAAGTPVRLESTGALPAPLSSSTVYYVLEVVDADDLIKISLSPSGPAVALSDQGDEDAVHEVVVQVGAVIDAVLLATSLLWVEDMTAHRGEISNAPEHVRKGICEEAAGNIVTTRGLMRPGYADPSIAGRAAEARRQRARYRAGAPVHGLVDSTPNIADNGAVFELLGGTEETLV